ncbi:MAG: anhydro-N-acetylmuramic acid kinase [Rhodospirillaceae bacterium]|nr:anhydro-N-acetylmuramic acid kinase [Rhodospirillaceae bacterium]|tara:strand:+ start:25493 stop:26569 length:1077 start_codon:yes stop_codon:yes gene_type:complete
MENTVLALGLMSGTSLDGIDAALVRTDGSKIVKTGEFLSLPYTDKFREKLRSILGGIGDVKVVERELTLLHVDAAQKLIEYSGRQAADIDVIGFHGHTILHNPDKAQTWQIGDGALLASETGIDVVCDMRSRDVDEGGQGAPLAPLFHHALASEMEQPLVVLNIGGVSNVTYVNGDESSLIAFDTGPGGALIDDWVSQKCGIPFDRDGQIAASGEVANGVLDQLLDSPYFDTAPPKSLDRNQFDVSLVQSLSMEDGAATLTAFTSVSITRALPHFPEKPLRWLVTGGGRHNKFLMANLSRELGVDVEPVEAVGWNGDALEAQAFAYLAVQSRKGLPLTYPGTTGAKGPTTGGVYFSSS